MSYSFATIARNKAAALAFLDERQKSGSAPAVVFDWLRTAVSNIQEKPSLAAIEINAQGHLCNGPTSHDSSADVMKVHPVYVHYEAPKPAEAPAATAAAAGA